MPLQYRADAHATLSSSPNKIFTQLARHRGDFALPQPVMTLVEPTTTTGVPIKVKNDFKHHARRWIRDTQHLSSPTDRYLHPSYARIIGLIAASGDDGLRIILQDLRDNHNDWFYALRSITGEDPVAGSMAGNVPLMVDAWLKWGRQRGLIDGHTAQAA